MAKKWQEVSPEEAKKHPLYGISGWLALFAVGTTLGPFIGLSKMNEQALAAKTTLTDLINFGGPIGSYIRASLVIDFMICGFILLLLITKSSKFRSWTTVAMFMIMPLNITAAVMYPFPGVGEGVAASIAPWLMSCIVWITYLHRSKRVRVTFEHQVKVAIPKTAKQFEKIAPTTSSLRPDPVVRTHASPGETIPLQPTPETAPAFVDTPPTSEKKIEPHHQPAVDISEEHWEEAAAEVTQNRVKPGLWAKCYAEAGGEMAATKAAYLKARAAQLMVDYR